MSLETTRALLELVRRDRRYPLQAYLFIFEALHYAQEHLGWGREAYSEPRGEEDPENPPRPQRHLTGQELCEAIRRYALEQFGYMARCVFRCWNVHSTSDFGEMVYNLIEAGLMQKTPEDRREDFDNVYQLDTALEYTPQFQLPWSQSTLSSKRHSG